ncbi:TlpA disulfide reductase family protein [Robertmurraya sp. FSL W8-0741]|uniref:TlpA disulfide reductase family protein n=1 Tax=Robertmurraya TaxID=2837507 RepID=UPI000BA5BCB8|nr:TlpA disulfide reductase family protein [Robertmurraya siralis]PAE22375.1 thiol:disulfide interchange protein [Bacillus sp. 7504-2]
MKKFLFIFVSIVILLFIIDRTILKQSSDDSDKVSGEQYEKIADPDSLPVGVKKEERAPSFAITTLDGEDVTLDDYKGKKVLLNFWATWCPPCRKEMPDMQQLYEENRDDDFVVLAVNMTNTEKKRSDVVQFVDHYQLTFPILMDENGKVAQQYEILSYPTSFFIDSDGVIRGKIVGEMSKEMMYKEMILLP